MPPKKSAKETWNEGPPPSEGWWPASIGRDKACVRWYSNDYGWSLACNKFFYLAIAAQRALVPARSQHKIEWTERPDDWPERSRT